MFVLVRVIHIFFYRTTIYHKYFEPHTASGGQNYRAKKNFLPLQVC